MTNAVSILRNLVCIKVKPTAAVKIVFIVIQTVLGVVINDMGLLGWLPILAGIGFTWFIDLKDDVKFKVMIIVCQTMWIFYDFSLKNYVSFSFDIFTVISTIIGIKLILDSRRDIKETKK